MVKPSVEYHTALNEFITRLTKDQRQSQAVASDASAYFETGRKFDKILIKNGGSVAVRYFVKRTDGTIYGAKSRFAPNVRWWMGTIYRSHLWNWSQFHGQPVNDPNVRIAKTYGPYQSFLDV